MKHQNDAVTAGVATPPNEKALDAATNSDKGLGKIDLADNDFKGVNLAEQGDTAATVPRSRKRKADAINPSEIRATIEYLRDVAGMDAASSFTRLLNESASLALAASALRKMAQRLNDEQCDLKSSVEAEASKLDEKAAAINAAAQEKCLRAIVESGGEQIRYIASKGGRP